MSTTSSKPACLECLSHHLTHQGGIRQWWQEILSPQNAHHGHQQSLRGWVRGSSYLPSRLTHIHVVTPMLCIADSNPFLMPVIHFPSSVWNGRINKLGFGMVIMHLLVWKSVMIYMYHSHYFLIWWKMPLWNGDCAYCPANEPHNVNLPDSMLALWYVSHIVGYSYNKCFQQGSMLIWCWWKVIFEAGLEVICWLSKFCTNWRIKLMQKHVNPYHSG